jgi:hypothetical protein
MGNLWKFHDNPVEIIRFSKDLGESLEKRLGEKVTNCEVFLERMDGNAALVYWKSVFRGEIMITESQSDKRAYTIHQFWSVSLPQEVGGKPFIGSSDLRNAANAYDEVTAFLEENYGKPFSEHDGRSMYRALKPEP